MKKSIIILLISLNLFGNDILIPDYFKAEFTQIITSPKGEKKEYKGVFRFNKPEKIKWEYIKPLKKEICSNKDFISIVNHNLEQVTFYKGTSSYFDLPKVLKNAKHYKDRRYTAKLGSKLYTIVIDKNKRLKQILFRDDLDNIININFIKMKYLKKENKNKKMECVFPKYYDIIKD